MRISEFVYICVLSLYVQYTGAQSESESINKFENVAIQYLALGDSYTIGESVDSSLRFPNLLSLRLRQEGINSDVQVVAKTGWTTDELLSAIESSAKQETRYDLVSLLIGVNNQYRSYPITQYNEEFKVLLDKAIDFAQGNPSRVFVLSIPDYSVTPFGQSRPENEIIASEIDKYNKIATEICTEKSVAYFEITTISREALTDPELVADDGLHPSGKMYGQWVDKIYNDVKSLIFK